MPENKESVNKNNKVPKLRFAGFSKGWKQTPLCKLSSDISYGLGAPAKKFDGNNKYLRITDIDEATNQFIYDDLTSPDCMLNDYYLLKENDLLFARTGASTGKTYLYNKNDGKIYFAGFLIRFRLVNVDPKFIFYQTKTSKYFYWVSVYSKRSGQPGINASEYSKYNLGICSITEQNKISTFLTMVDSKINIITNKINTLKKYKKGLEKKAIKYIITNGKKIEFPLMFEEYKYFNKNKFPQYTVGKNGLIKIEDINYNLFNHSIFSKNNLLVGIGIDEIAISITDEGCVSPVYTVYLINDHFDTYYFYWFLKDLLIKQKRFITKKSTRREFEIDKKELKKCKISYVVDAFIKSSISSLNTVDSRVRNYAQQLNLLRFIKIKLLKDMFI